MQKCAKCGEALDAVVGIDRHGRMYHPECDPKDALSTPTRAKILEVESEMILAQRQWERVKLVASMAAKIYCMLPDSWRSEISIARSIAMAEDILKAAEKLCQETKT